MTTFLTFSVYSLRVANDIPIQSEYLPYIFIYFIFSVLYTLLSMIWFMIVNKLSSKVELPRGLEVISGVMKKILSCNFKQKRENAKIGNAIANKKLEAIPEVVVNIENPKPQINTPVTSEQAKLCEIKCLKCDICKKCQTGIDQEKQKFIKRKT